MVNLEIIMHFFKYDMIQHKHLLNNYILLIKNNMYKRHYSKIHYGSDIMELPIERKRIMYSVIAALLVVFVTTLATLLYIERTQYGNKLQGRYQKELYDLMDNVQNLDTDLAKVSVVSSPQQSTLIFGDIWRQAGAATDRINSLPVIHTAISEASKFLSQVSGFAYSIVKNRSNGQGISDDQWKTVSELRKNASYLKGQLLSLQREMEDGNITWTDISYEGSRILGSSQDNITDGIFTDISQEIQKYPSLIYDGPFSEDVLNITPRVTAEPVITMEQAKAKLNDIFGSGKIAKISTYSSKEGGSIGAYPFQVTLKGRNENAPIYIDISKNGGHVIYMLDTRDVGQQSMDIKKAIDLGLKYLESLGLKDMTPLYTQRTYNTIVANYVYTQTGGNQSTLIYPDQVKLKIALDNGEIIGVEAQKYFTSHASRSIPKPALTAADARGKVSRNLTITNTRLAVIPLSSQKEVFCYEFIGKAGGSTYIVYINAENGSEEDILQIIDTPGGQLAL